MSDIEIVHPVPVDEIEPWMASMATAFLEDPAEFRSEAPGRARSWVPDRAWGARADGRWVGTLRTVAREITVPGGPADLPADALTNVTVAATHRRQGLLTTMLNESLLAARERGEPVSILIAAEWPIYGRFGYAAASDVAYYTVRSRERGSRILRAATGTVRQVEPEELRRIAPDLFAAARRRRAGDIDRPWYWWDRQLGPHLVAHPHDKAVTHVIHEGPAGVDGYVSWSSTGTWTLTGQLGEVTVQDLVAANDDAYAALWHYLFGIDVVDQIHLHDRPVDEQLHWLLADARVMTQTDRVDRMWLRVLDLPRALAARRYGVEDSVVLEVVDPDGPYGADRPGYAAGRYRLEGGPDGAQCTATTESADLRVHQRALASAYLGGFSLTAFRPAGLVEELRSGALARTDALFATAQAPWCATSF